MLKASLSRQDSLRQSQLSELSGVTTWVFSPLVTTEQEAKEHLQGKPSGTGIRVGAYVYRSNGPTGPVTQVCVSEIPDSYFADFVSNLEDQDAALMTRMEDHKETESLTEFRVLNTERGNLFHISYQPGHLLAFTNATKKKNETYFDLTWHPLGHVNKPCEPQKILYWNREVAEDGSFQHSGDRVRNCSLHHGVTVLNMRPFVMYGLCWVGYKQEPEYESGTPLRLFLKQVPQGAVVDVEGKQLHLLHCPLQKVMVRDNNFALVAVCMRVDTDVWWHVLPVPQLTAGVLAGARNQEVNVAETVAHAIARRAFQDAGVLAPVCAACGKQDKPLKVCSRCKVERYCDRSCQRAAWDLHKPFCARIAQAAGHAGSTAKAQTEEKSAAPAAQNGIPTKATPEAPSASPLSEILCVCAVQGGVPPKRVSSLTKENQTLFVTYNNRVSLGYDPDESMGFLEGKMLPLAPVSDLEGPSPTLGGGKQPRGSLSLSATELEHIQSRARAYLIHVTPDGVPASLRKTANTLVNGLTFIHCKRDESLEQFLLRPEQLAEVRAKVKEALLQDQKQRNGRRMTPEDKERIEVIKRPLTKHLETVEKLIDKTDAGPANAQVGPQGTVVLYLGGRLLMYRQGVVLPGLLDELYDAGVEVTSLLTPEKLRQWVGKGGLQQYGFPVLYEVSEQLVFLGGKMQTLEEVYQYLSSLGFEGLLKNSLDVAQVLRQIPFILEASEIEQVRNKLLAAISSLASKDEEVEELDRQICAALARDSIDRREVRALVGKKRGLQKHRLSLLEKVTSEVQALESNRGYGRKANQKKMGVKLIQQIAHTKKNLKKAEGMTADDVMDFLEDTTTGVMCLELHKGYSGAALEAVSQNRFLKFVSESQFLREGISCGLNSVPLDGITYSAFAQGGQGDDGHLLHVAGPEPKGLLCPARVSSGYAPSWDPANRAFTDVKRQQNSFFPAPCMKRFQYLPSLMQPWQKIAQEDDVQLMRQLIRGQFCSLRKFPISGGSVDLSFFLITSWSRLLEVYCEPSTSQNKTQPALTEKDQKDLQRLAALDPQISGLSNGPSQGTDEPKVDGKTEDGCGINGAALAALEKEKENLLKDSGLASHRFLSSKVTNFRSIFMSVLAACGAGQQPACDVYEMFTPGKSSFRTPPADQFFLYPTMLRLAGQTGCPMSPVLHSCRRFVLGELWKSFGFVWQPMMDRVADIDALARQEAAKGANEKLYVLRRAVHVIFHMGGIAKTPANKTLLKEMAGRALSFFPTECYAKRALKTLGGRSLAIFFRFFLRVHNDNPEDPYDWDYFPLVQQHAWNVLVKHGEAFVNDGRLKILEAAQTGDATTHKLAVARFLLSWYKKQTSLLGHSEQGLDAKALLKAVRAGTDKAALDKLAPMPLRNQVLAQEQVKLLEEKLQLASSKPSPAVAQKLKCLEAKLQVFSTVLPNPIVLKGPKDMDAPEGGQRDTETPYLLVRGGCTDLAKLKKNLVQEGVPWSVQTDLQQARARRRMFLQAKKDQEVQECDEEIRRITLKARLDAKAAEEDTRYIITGKRTVREEKTKKEAVGLAQYQGKHHPDVIQSLLPMGDSASGAIQFCQELDGLSLPSLWSRAKITLDSKTFLELLGLVGVPREEALPFLRRVILALLPHWRDRDAAFRAALALFPSDLL